MLLWLSSRCGRVCLSGSSGGCAGEVVVDLAGDEPFEAAHDVLFGQAFFGAALDVSAGAFVETHAGEHDGVQCVVRGPVAAAVEAVAVRAAGRGRDRSDTGQVRK